MQNSDGTSPAPAINKMGASQPHPTAGSSGRNPGQGSGAVQSVHGKNTPTIVKTGATNNGK